MNISVKGVATLKKASGVTFNKYNIVQLKNTTFKEQMANQNLHIFGIMHQTKLLR